MRLLSVVLRWWQRSTDRGWPASLLPASPGGLVIGVLSLYVIYTGLFNYVLAVPPPPSRSRALSWILSGPIDQSWYGVLMIVVGVVALFASYCRRGSVDTIAQPLLSTFSLAWGAVFFLAWVLPGERFDASFSDVRGLIGTWWIAIYGTTLAVQLKLKGVKCA